MKPANRRQWILDYMIREQKRMGTSSYHVDVLNGDFVDDYIEATGATYYACFYGAHKCPQLGEDLSKMHREGLLDRYATGISDLAGMGFPRWVYCYSVRNPHG